MSKRNVFYDVHLRFYFHFREQRAQAASQKISEYQAKEKARVAVSMNTRWNYT